MVNEIHDDSVSKVRGVPPVSSTPDVGSVESPRVDSGVSSIEKSKAVRPEVVPPMNTPILIAPADQQGQVFAVASLDAMGKPVTSTIHSVVLQGEKIKQAALEGWMNNLREIAEYVRQLLASPLYQQLQEMRLQAGSQVGPIAGVTSPGAAAGGEQVELLSTLDRLQALEHVPPSAEVQDTSASKDSTGVLVLPLTAALLAGGGLMMGTEIIHATNPIGGLMEMVTRLQPLFPTVSVQDLVPLINLMVVGPIYFNSWNEAVNNITSRERQNHIPAIHNFAKDVIKIVLDPNFVNSTLIQCMKGTENLTSADKDRLARMLKVLLVGVALSLMYSAEVGKVQNGRFGGMEPEELRDLLMGKFTELPEPGKNVSEHEQLVNSLISRAWEQLKFLSVEDRTAAVDMLLAYVTKHRDLDPMLSPAKIFDDAVDASKFNPKTKIGIVRA